MPLPYGFAKAKLTSDPILKPTRRPHETQYHLHFSMTVNGAPWDFAINVGTDQGSDLLKYKLIDDFRHPVIETLGAAADHAARELTGETALPALDFMRSDLLANTGDWRQSSAMDGTDAVEPTASLKRLLFKARHSGLNVYVFGRFYTDGRQHNNRHHVAHSNDHGIHDAHMNHGSTGGFIHRPGDDSNDHNDIWQDGAVFVQFAQSEWAAYFAAFDQQLVPTDDLGNPTPDAQPI